MNLGNKIAAQLQKNLRDRADHAKKKLLQMQANAKQPNA